MKKELEEKEMKEMSFPRTYTTSSAGYRVIRQLQEKGDKRNFKLVKNGEKDFEVSVKVILTLDQFKKEHRDLTIDGVTYRYYPEGSMGEGFYELKTGDRRRANSNYLMVGELYESYLKG